MRRRTRTACRALRSGETARAEQVFRDDFKQWPRNGWGCLASNNLSAPMAKPSSRMTCAAKFNEAWKNADVKLELARF